MAYRNYNETDISFYSENELEDFVVDYTSKGTVVSWEPVPHMAGYAIYRGKPGKQKLPAYRYYRILAISTHRASADPLNKEKTRMNVAVSEIEMIKLGQYRDCTEELPITSFTSSSVYSSNANGASKAFDNTFSEIEGGWQSQGGEESYQWITVDFGTPVKIAAIHIQNSWMSLGLCGIKDYRIEVSNDNYEWKTLLEGQLIRDTSVQRIDLFDFFQNESTQEDGWQLLRTVGSEQTVFTDNEPLEGSMTYRVTSLVEGDLFFETVGMQYDEEGNPVEMKDLKLTGDHESARQDVTNRLRTQKGQWRSHQDLGANLELLEGEPNNRETANKGIEMITEALSSDNRFYESDFTVRPVPTSVTHVDYYVIVDSDENEPLVLKQSLDM